MPTILRECVRAIILESTAETVADGITHVSQVRVDDDGMRPESFELVRKQRASNIKMRPIEVDVYPETGPILGDGRHRLAIAKELGDASIEAIIRVYDDDANVLFKTRKALSL